MRVDQLGEGTPEVAVVAGVHGDEPCGVRAVEDLLANPPEVRRPVKFVVANEAAIDREMRYVQADLNRSFPGDADGETHEARLAAEITEELEGCATLSLHSTRSYADPFAVVSGVDDLVRRVVPALSVDAVVDAASFVEGRLFASGGVVEVECGLQGSDEAAENARELIGAFLAAMDALDAPVERESTPLFRLTRPLPKSAGDEYEVYVDNFRRVEAGETYAAADDERLVASDPFYPVLLSAYGYTDLFGYAADRIGTVP
ncbi:succinylglutamate desuccinylase [Halobacteriales archaeon QS_1_68_20]|nr:MAG: succinylglutamate desuccinylase [Halobacteriales archaeon QS_1_68_20]